MNSRRLLVIVGPTASGKTAASLEIAKRLNGEIICADSRTVYKGMDIGTAKPSLQEQADIPHHLLDIVTPDVRYTVAQFKADAEEAIVDIRGRGRLPIMVGGTGLYIDSVLFNYQFMGQKTERDSVNPRHLKESDQRDRENMRHDALVVGIRVSKEVLEQRISARVDQMVQLGLVQEVQRLSETYGWEAPGLQAPAYKAFRSYGDGSASLDEAKAAFKRNDLQLAKRQRTWFKRNPGIQWFDDPSRVVTYITTKLST